jgi:hypothetical protein
MKGAAIFNGCQGIGNANAKNSKKEEEVPQRPRARRKIALYLRGCLVVRTSSFGMNESKYQNDDS